MDDQQELRLAEGALTAIHDQHAEKGREAAAQLVAFRETLLAANMPAKLTNDLTREYLFAVIPDDGDD